MHRNLLSERLAFFGIDQTTSTTLAASKSFLMAELPALLDSFYDHVSDFDAAAKFFRSREHMMHAKQKQLDHWAIILDGKFDEHFQESVTRIGEIHNKLGLGTTWYLGGYRFLISGLLDAINQRLPGNRLERGLSERKYLLQTAVLKAAMLDMDFAISVYIEAGQRDRVNLLTSLARDFDAAFGNAFGIVATAASELTDAAASLKASAQETSDEANAVSEAAGKTSSNIVTVAAAAEQLAASVHEIGQQVSTANSMAEDAKQRTDQFAEQIAKLSDAASHIGTITTFIKSIAGQTNLLALNATIEAARAGEAGKGFSVVAQEVKGLAAQTAKATADISSQIENIQQVVATAVTQITMIAGVIGKVNETSIAIAAAVDQQGAATQEIARNTQDVATSTTGVSRSISDIAKLATGTGASATQVDATSSQLSQHSDRLRTEVNQFLTKLRASAA